VGRFILKIQMMKFSCQYCFILVALLGCNTLTDSIVDIPSLLTEMANRESLTYFPSARYQLFQVSSWDRNQTDPADPEKWFVNKDYNYSIREEKRNGKAEFVIMDVKGAGVITRWWLPQEQMLKNRIVRIYLDGDPVPRIEENYQDFINGNSFIKWPFAFTSSDEANSIHQYNLPVGHHKQMGAGMYFPIPFASSCKITLDVIPFYYVINYRLYEDDITVKSFTKGEFDSHKELINSIGAQILKNDNWSNDLIIKSENINPGGLLEVNLPSGGGKSISGIKLNIHSKEKKQINRGIVLQIEFDGAQTVWSPVSEFYGGGVYARNFRNYVNSVDIDGVLNSQWLMPYKNTAKLTIKNYSSEAVQANLEVSITDYEWNDRSMYFHANWHEEAPLNTPPFKDWNYVEVKGKGIYVGDVLTIHSSVKPWWGEGDEKIYIDGETFPSQIGTGLEDYYGYAWGMANYFSSPFISMPERDARGKDDWRGYTTVSRLRFLDAIPFDEKIKVDVEAWQVEPGVSYSASVFWYGLPDATANISPDEETVKRKLEDYIPVSKVKIPGSIFSDPALHGLIEPKGNKTIQQIGNQLDLLEWKNPNFEKPLDADGDNRLGTSGYHLIGLKRFDAKKLDFIKDSTRSLPGYVDSLILKNVASNKINNTWLFVPEDTTVCFITGKIEANGHEASKGFLTFSVNQKVPASFRLGIMLDNADGFDKVGKFLKVKSLMGGNSGEIPLAGSNRIPDWYFFDLKNLKPNDQITIYGITENKSDLFTIGGLTFD